MIEFRKCLLHQHVTTHPDGGWQVKGAGNSRATARTNTQSAAIEIARNIAINQLSEVVIHRLNGQIRDKTLMGMTHILQKDNVKGAV